MKNVSRRNMTSISGVSSTLKGGADLRNRTRVVGAEAAIVSSLDLQAGDCSGDIRMEVEELV